LHAPIGALLSHEVSKLVHQQWVMLRDDGIATGARRLTPHLLLE
jgi:predicted phosphoribosyltransferase